MLFTNISQPAITENIIEKGNLPNIENYSLLSTSKHVERQELLPDVGREIPEEKDLSKPVWKKTTPKIINY